MWTFWKWLECTGFLSFAFSSSPKDGGQGLVWETQLWENCCKWLLYVKKYGCFSATNDESWQEMSCLLGSRVLSFSLLVVPPSSLHRSDSLSITIVTLASPLDRTGLSAFIWEWPCFLSHWESRSSQKRMITTLPATGLVTVLQALPLLLSPCRSLCL